MASKGDILELVPHYVAMILIVLFAMALIRQAIGQQHIVVEFVIILVLVFAYRPLVLRLEVVPTPTVWERYENN